MYFCTASAKLVNMSSSDKPEAAFFRSTSTWYVKSTVYQENELVIATVETAVVYKSINLVPSGLSLVSSASGHLGKRNMLTLTCTLFHNLIGTDTADV